MKFLVVGFISLLVCCVSSCGSGGDPCAEYEVPSDPSERMKLYVDTVIVPLYTLEYAPKYIAMSRLVSIACDNNPLPYRPGKYILLIDEDVDLDATVSYEAKEKTMRQVLNGMCRSAKLKWSIEGEKIVISNR